MNLHLNKELFREFIDNLNTKTGIDSDIIEKDYYVCTILKELSKNQDELQAYFKGGTAKTSTKLLKEAKSITNAIVNVPSGSYMAVLSTKKVGLLSFYKVRYSDSRKSYVGYVTAKHIVLQ